MDVPAKFTEISGEPEPTGRNRLRLKQLRVTGILEVRHGSENCRYSLEKCNRVCFPAVFRKVNWKKTDFQDYFIIGVILGSLAVRISLGPESSPLLGIVSAGTITCLVLLTDMLNLKSSWFRKMEEGEPIFLIQKGRLLDQNLSRAKISVSKLMMLLREKMFFM